MAQISISQLPQAAPLTGLELVPIVQNGVTVQTTTGTLTSAGGFQTITVNGPISSPSNKGAISYGTLTFSDINIFESFQTSANTYAQTIIQNSNSGSSASVDYVVNNNLSTASTFYGAFGMNSSNYSGTGNIRNQPNVVYLEAMSGDLAIGTLTANPIHFIVNDGTDAMMIGATGIVSIFGTTPSTSTGTGALVISGGLGVAGTTTSAAIVATENITGALSAGAFSYGTLAYTDINIFESLTTLANNYSQTILQNTSSGTAASVDFIVSNNSGTASTFYGDFGMTSSGYNTPGQNITNSPSTVYLQSASTDLAIGTLNANNLHIMTNSVERATISSVGVISALANIASTTTGTGTLVVTGGVGVSGAINAGSFNGSIGSTPASGAFTTLSASSTVTLSPASANVAISPTGTGTVTINPAAASTINNVSIGATVPSTGAFTALTNSATLAQFDSTTKAATTAFTQAVGLKTNARNTVTVTGTLPASYAGSHVIVNSSSSTVQTLPTATSVTAGYQILLTNIGAGSAAVTRNGTDTINFSNGTNGTVLTMFQGDTLFLESNGSNGWDAVDGSVISPYTPSSSESSIGRNVIINGDCSISQLNGTTLITPLTQTYPTDMCLFGATQASKIQFQQVANKLNSLGATAANNWSVLASYVPIATDYFDCLYSVEGNNFARFQWGTANAKPASLQFKVNASVAGTYSGAITNYASTRSYPFSFTVAAGVDTLITIPNIPGDTSGTWVGATNAGAALVKFDLGAGANYKGTANAWASANLCGVTGCTNLVSQVNGSTLSITDVQLEVGSVCTQFERKLYWQSLMECQRYYVLFGGQYAGTSGTGVINLIVLTGCTMRAIPTCTNAASGSGSGYASAYSGSTWSSVAVSANSFSATSVGAAFVNIQAPYGSSVQGFPCAGSVSGALSAQI